MENKSILNTGRAELRRRTFLAGLAGTGLATLLPGGAFAQNATPQRGGTIVVAFAGGVDTLDPHSTLSAQGQQISLAIYEGLTELDADRLPKPRLATSWTAEKGGEEWVFQLREGVKFHDGSDFTAEDVVATIDRSFDDSKGLRSKGAFGPVKEVRAEGPHTVRLVMSQPCAETPALVANRWAMITPKAGLDKIDTVPNGTGAFIFESFEPGASVTLKRNDNYWIPELPYADGIRVVAISQSVAQQAALRSGDVHIVEFLASDSYLTLQNASGITAYSIPLAQYHTLMTNASVAPFDNPKVREAFRYLIDRKTLLGSALLGQGTLGNDIPLLASNIYVPELAQNDQNLELARKLLDEAGVKDLSVEVYTSSDRQPSPKIAVALQQGAAQIGVNIQIRDVPYTEYVANVARKKTLYTSQWNDRLTLYEALYQLYHSKQPFNYSGVELAPGLDALLEKVIAELDLEKRKALAHEALEIIHLHGDRIIPYFMNYMCATLSKLQGYVPPSNGTTDLRRVWFAD